MPDMLHRPFRLLRAASRRLRGSEEGWMTPFALILSIALIGLGGFAVDVSHVMTQRTQLQVTADASAHAAMIMRTTETEAVARTHAVDLALANMPAPSYGNVIDDTTVVFGTWNPVTRVFTPVPGSREAVMVTAQRRRQNSNPVPTFLLRIVGIDRWDITAVSIFSSADNPCSFNGALANRIARFRSNGIFADGFCIHGNDHVSLRQGNTFLPGSVVSMPDLDRLDIPSSGMEGNPGLEDALAGGVHLDLASVVQSLPDRINDLRNDIGLPEYINTTQPRVTLNANQVNASTFQNGRRYHVNCPSSNGTLSLTNSMNLTNVVITTNCNVQFGQGTALRDSMLATTNISDTSISGASNAEATVGTACAPGSGTQVWTMGGMRFPAKLTVNGGQFVAARSITFASQATIEGSGVSLIAGQDVDWTSNASMSIDKCDEKFENHLTETRIRMVG